MKMKGLNNKGFTLIELLAVIVILALVVGITVPSVLNSMNSSRISTLHTNAVSFANWYNETVAQDELLASDDKTIAASVAQSIAQENGSWKCLKDIDIDGEGDGTTTLAQAYDLSESNFKITTGTAPTGTGVPTVSANTCSAIRSIDGKIEVLLVANPEGRYNVNSYVVTYAISSEDNGCTGASNGTCEAITEASETTE